MVNYWDLRVNELNLNLKVLCSCTAVIYIKCFKLVATKLSDKDDIDVIQSLPVLLVLL